MISTQSPDIGGASPDIVKGDIRPDQLVEISRKMNLRYAPNVTNRRRSEQRASVSGSVSLQKIASGLNICVSDVTALESGHHAGVLCRSSTIAIMLDGEETRCSLSKSQGFHLKPMSAMLVNVSDTAALANHLEHGARARTILIQCRPEAISDDRLGSAIQHLTKGTGTRGLPFQPRTRRLAQQLFAPDAPGLIQQLLTESFALEMLANMLGHIGTRDEATTAALSPRDRAALTLVRDMIEAQPGQTYTLSGLACEAGMSVASLKRKFPMMFGASVFSFLREVRLDQAREGLEHEGWTIGEAAHFVGYAHVSNFSTAFRRRHGVPPGALRQT